jgi:Ca-activated chloride channel family protein
MRSVIFSFLLALAATALANDSSKQLSPSIQQKSRSSAPAESSLRVDVSMALAPVSVTDVNGRNVTGLQRENFRLLDNKQPRDIASFSEEDQPVTVGMIFDCSRSMLNKFTVARDAPAQLYRQLNDRDESFLITISDRPTVRHALTSNFEELQNALFFTKPDGSTALLDGVYLGLTQIRKARNPRRALIVVSDGGDNNSRYTLGELKKMAAESDAQIFAIGLHLNPTTVEERDGPELLAALTRASGGIHYSIASVDEIAGVMAKIGTTLRNQYVLGYYPPSSTQSGKYHSITVQLKLPSYLPTLRIYARAGYYTPER